MKRTLLCAFSSAVLSTLLAFSYAQEKNPVTYIDLKNGRSLVGWLTSQTTDSVVLKTRHGDYRLARADIKSMETEGGSGVPEQKPEQAVITTPVEIPVPGQKVLVQPPDTARYVVVTLKSKRIIRGKLLTETNDDIRVRTESGTTYQLARSEIRSMEYLLAPPNKESSPMARPVEKTKEMQLDSVATIQLKDNTTIVGSILSWVQDSVIVNTAYGTMVIPRTKVSSIRMGSSDRLFPFNEHSDDLIGQSVVLHLKEGGRVRGTLTGYLSKDRIAFDTERFGVVTYDLIDVVRIEKGSSTAETEGKTHVTVGASDDGREGFIIGFGLGVGSTNLSSTVRFSGFPPYVKPSEISHDTSSVGLITDFRIGHAPSDQLAIFWTAKVAWLLGYTPKAYSGNGTIAATYYFAPYAPSFFLSAGLGLATYTTLESLSRQSSESSIGFGFFLGAGYEFAKHWDFEADVIFGSPGTGVDEVTLNTLTIKITLNFLSY